MFSTEMQVGSPVCRLTAKLSGPARRAIRVHCQVRPGLRDTGDGRTAGDQPHDRPVAAIVSLSQVGHYRPHIVPMRPRIRFPRRPHFLQQAVLIHRPALRPATPPACRSTAVMRPGSGAEPASAGSTGKRFKQICYLLLERRDRVFQCRTRICVEQIGIANIRARPIKAVLPDGEMAAPGCFMGVERNEKTWRTQLVRFGNKFSPKCEPRVGFVDLINMFPIDKVRESRFDAIHGSSNLGRLEKHAPTPRNENRPGHSVQYIVQMSCKSRLRRFWSITHDT
jgi:hypothetical protein